MTDFSNTDLSHVGTTHQVVRLALREILLNPSIRYNPKLFQDVSALMAVIAYCIAEQDVTTAGVMEHFHDTGIESVLLEALTKQ